MSFATIGTGIIIGAVVGAGVGAAGSAIAGGDPGEGAMWGAIGGGVTGGVGGAFAGGGAGAAGGAASGGGTGATTGAGSSFIGQAAAQGLGATASTAVPTGSTIGSLASGVGSGVGGSSGLAASLGLTGGSGGLWSTIGTEAGKALLSSAPEMLMSTMEQQPTMLAAKRPGYSTIPQTKLPKMEELPLSQAGGTPMQWQDPFPVARAAEAEWQARRGLSTFAEGGEVALEDGQFILPADIVSALGNGSTKAGARFLDEFFGLA